MFQRKNLYINIALLFVSTACLLLALEIISRSLQLCPNKYKFFAKYDCFKLSDNERLIYELNPSTAGVNSDGMYDKERSVKKTPNTIRIAILGDSVAAGCEVKREERFSNLLEDKLNKASAANTSTSNLRYEVLNFSVPGYNTTNEVEQLKTKVAKYKPDIIVLSYFINDNDPLPSAVMMFFDIMHTPSLVGPNRFFNALWNFKPTKFLVIKSDFFRFVVRRVYLLTSVMVNQKQSHQNVISAFNELREYADHNSTKVIVLFNPALDYEENNYSGDEMVIIKKLSEVNKFSFINMLEIYRNNFKSQEDIWNKGLIHPVTKKQDMDHPNARGHELIAGELLKEITRLSN